MQEMNSSGKLNQESRHKSYETVSKGARIKELKHVHRRRFLQSSAAFGLCASTLNSSLLPTISEAAVGRVIRTYNLAVTQGLRGPAYNGKVPGPTLIAKSGETIEVNFSNELLAVNDDCTDSHNRSHGLNTTNLHTHGLHVSPAKDSTLAYDSDNVFLSIVPQNQVVPCWNENFKRAKNTYRFELPTNHPAGTYWYHAHKHGSTAQQVAMGLAGPLIIEDPDGSMPKYIADAEEKIFMFTSRGAVLADPDGGGITRPTIKLRPGEVQRWRIINARPFGDAFAYLQVDDGDVEIWQIAYDGVTLPRRIKINPSHSGDPWFDPAALAPGNRTDLLIRVPKESTSKSLKLRAVPYEFKNPHEIPAAFSALPIEINIEIEGEPIEHEWPADNSLPGPGIEPLPMGDIPTRKITFSDSEGNFVIDGAAYDGVVKHSMALGSTEEWTVYNADTKTHPFHIHVNPFFITKINGKELSSDDPLRRWQDTIALPPSDGINPGSITFRTRFADFKGKFVIHCHILLHEDAGMMQAIEVV